MIDTQEKLDKFVESHRIDIVAEAMKAFVSTSDDDVWDTFHVSGGEECDYNIYQTDEGTEGPIYIHAYALRHVPEDAPHTLQVNTGIGCHVADIKWEAA
jgi:hypothetical protein